MGAFFPLFPLFPVVDRGRPATSTALFAAPVRVCSLALNHLVDCIHLRGSAVLLTNQCADLFAGQLRQMHAPYHATCKRIQASTRGLAALPFQSVFGDLGWHV